MAKISAGAHLKELRMRFFIVAIFFIVGACLAYAFQQQVISAVLAPLNGQKLVYLNPAGGFSFIFLISIYAGLAMAIPILIQQLYVFVRPALPQTAQKKSSTLIIGSFILLVAGILFGYFVAVPNALTFLYNFAESYIEASLTAESYLNFVIAYTIGIGLVFQIPLLLLLVNSIKPLTPGGLMKSEKWVLLISFIVAAIITPTPDPVNQLIIAGPVIIVYQIGVVIILVSIHQKYRAGKRVVKKAAKATVLANKGKKQHHKPTHTPAPQRVPQPAHSLAATTNASRQRPKASLQTMQGLVAHQRPLTMVNKPQPVALVPNPPVIVQPSTPVAVAPIPAPTHTINDFARPKRPAVQPIIVPQREEPQVQQVVRAVPRNPSPTQRNFTIDGMYRPFYPNQTVIN